MSQEQKSFQAGIDFDSVLRIISKQVYETPLAFIRENVQNAVDAVRVQAYRDGAPPGEDAYRIDVAVEGREITVLRQRDRHDRGRPQEIVLDDWRQAGSALLKRKRQDV